MVKEQAKALQTGTEATVFSILLTISFSHLLNDTIQSLIPSIYPLVKVSYHLSFSQVGLITLTFQLAASLFQPLVGFYTDKKPQPFSLSVGMGLTLCGLIVLALNTSYSILLLSVGLIGLGSSVFHPEASKVAYMASGGRRGLAQSIFQVGGNAGSAIGPLLAAAIIVPFGQTYILWFSLLALLAICLLYVVGKWYSDNRHRIKPKRSPAEAIQPAISKRRITLSVIILLVLIFSKYFYLASMSNYYTFYLINKFHVSVQTSQVYLFVFLFSVAAGTLLGGPLGDRFGRKYIILVLHFGRCTVYSFASACIACFYYCADCFYRVHTGVGVFCYTGLCTRTNPRQSGHGSRFIFWFCFWHGRLRLCVAGHFSR